MFFWLSVESTNITWNSPINEARVDDVRVTNSIFEIQKQNKKMIKKHSKKCKPLNVQYIKDF